MSNINDKNEQQQPRVIEDRPAFYGMAVVSRLEPALKIESLSTPLVKPNRSSSSVSTVPVLKETTVTDDAPTTRLWPAKAELEPLPVIYMLERTHACIPDASAQEVGRRLSRCLQRESIAAEFHDDEAVIDAETSDCVQFSVRLWSAPAKNQVLVEVQKVSGCSYLYCQAARAILLAAKGREPPQQKREFTIPKSVVKHAAAVVKPHDSNAIAKEGIEIAFTLLQRKRLDARLMGVESLVQISKAAAAPFAAHAILCEKEELRTALLSMVVEEGPLNTSAQVGRGSCTEMEKEHNRLMSRHALAVLANCLEALEHSGGLETVLGEQGRELCAQKTLESLIAKVQASAENPHDACQAMRCIGSLVRGSSDTKQNALALGFYETVAAAHATGGRCHARLELECARLSL